jgi:hypothetical protein
MQSSGWTPPLAVYVPEEEQKAIDLEWMKIAIDQVSASLDMLYLCRCACKDSCNTLDVEAITYLVLIGTRSSHALAFRLFRQKKLSLQRKCR